MSKNHRFRFINLIMLVLTILSLSVVAAQNSLEDQPLLQMLMHVPDNATSRSEVYFNDRKAIEVAYPSAKVPTDWAAFQAYRDDKGKSDAFKPIDLWWRVWRNQTSSLLGRFLVAAPKMPEAVGFDFYSIEQELNYGRPPDQSLQLSGQFDLDKVRAALTAQGYTRQDQAGVEVWCGPDGCDKGDTLHVRDRNPANPFGGELGRKWPIVIQENNLVGSSDATVIQNHVAVKAGNSKSLGEAPEYRAAVEALTQNGVLMQAYFWDGEILGSLSELPAAIVSVPQQQRKALIEAMLKDYEPLPTFKLLGFGDIANDTEATGEVALVYGSEGDAKKAAEILPKRIAAYKSLVRDQSFAKKLSDFGVTRQDIQVLESNGQYVVLVSFATAKLSDDVILTMKPQEEGSRSDILPPGSIYRLLIGSAMQLDLGWLNSVSREILEAAAK